MKYIVMILLAVVVSGCVSTTIRAPFHSIADPSVQIDRSATLAFLPERDMRIEKRLLCERATEYLARSGFEMASPETADFLIRVWITTQLVTSVNMNTSPTGLTRRSELVDPEEGLSVFQFRVYRREDYNSGRQASIWEASVSVRQRDFRSQEETFITKIFSNFGRSAELNLNVPR